MKRIGVLFLFASLFLPLSQTQARVVALRAGIGDWFSDDLKTSYQYGGGLLVKPLDWLEFTATFDRAPAKLKSDHPLASRLSGETLSFYRLGVTFPMPVEVHEFKTFLYPLISYVATSNADDLTHGGGLGGGLEFLLYKEIIGARFEALEQMYKIPTSAGQTGLQEDFFFSLHLTASY